MLATRGAWPEAGGAGSGFVFEHDGYQLALNLGFGTLPRLLTLLGSSAGDGIDCEGEHRRSRTSFSLLASGSTGPPGTVWCHASETWAPDQSRSSSQAREHRRGRQP